VVEVAPEAVVAATKAVVATTTSKVVEEATAVAEEATRVDKAVAMDASRVRATVVVPPAEVAGVAEAAADSNPTAAAAVAEATAVVNKAATLAVARTPTKVVVAVATREAHNKCAEGNSLLIKNGAAVLVMAGL